MVILWWGVVIAWICCLLLVDCCCLLPVGLFAVNSVDLDVLWMYVVYGGRDYVLVRLVVVVWFDVSLDYGA